CLEIFQVNRLSVRLTPHVTKGEGVNRIGDGTYGAISKDDVEAAGVRGAKTQAAIPGGGVKIRRGWNTCAANDVVIPAGGITGVIIILALAQVGPVQALLPQQKGIGSAIGDSGYPGRQILNYHASLFPVAGAVITQGGGDGDAVVVSRILKNHGLRRPA